MKIIRWLLSHFFLILLIIVVIYSYMFWGNLAGEGTPAGKAIAYLSSEFVEVREFVDAIKARQQAASAEKSEKQAETHVAETRAAQMVEPAPAISAMAEENNEVAANEAPATDAGPAGNEITGTEITGTEIEVPPVSVSYEYKQSQAGTDSGDKMKTKKPEAAAGDSVVVSAADTEMTDKTGGDTARGDAFVPQETVEQLNNVDSHGRIIDTAKQTDAVRETWITARKSFYLRNYKLSEESYRKVIASTEDNFDAYGELGNVYFNQGKKAQAAEAYFEAASILVRKGQVSRARSLIGLLRHLDRAKAVELQKLIDSAVS